MTDLADLTQNVLEPIVQAELSALKAEPAIDQPWQGLHIDRVKAACGLATFHGYDSHADLIAEISRIGSQKINLAVDAAAVGSDPGLALIRSEAGQVALSAWVLEGRTEDQLRDEVNAVLLAGSTVDPDDHYDFARRPGN